MTHHESAHHQDKPVWLITGCSTGLGHALAKLVLERGYRTVVTARRPDDLIHLAAEGHSLRLELDVTDRGEVEAAVRAVEEAFGRIDVLVNNAGVSYFAAVEESDEDQVRRMFDVNVFGLSRMIHAALPGMRRRRSGFIVNVSSIGGLCAAPSLGYYNATKFAVEGLSEALWQEVEPLGIKVMLVEPSGLRTDWAGRSAEQGLREIDDYAETAWLRRRQLLASSGHEAGDPARAAQAIVDTVESSHPPHRLLLGNDAFEAAMSKLDELRSEFSASKTISRASDFPRK